MVWVRKMRRFAALFAAAAVLLVLFFHQEESPNPFSRLITTYALVEEHHLQADTWGPQAYDKAVIDGHTYTEKAPLSSFVVLPFYALMRAFEHGPQTAWDRAQAVHLANVVGAAAPFAIFLLLLLARARREGLGPAQATLVALLAGFGTFLFNYGGAFFGHMLAAAFLVGGWVLAVDRQERFVLAGFLGGCAVLTEYPVLLLQLVVLAALLTGPEPIERTKRYVLGALGPAVALVAWNVAITGHPLDFPYFHLPPYFHDTAHASGWIAPNVTVLWELTFGQFRGAFFYAPALLVLVPLLGYGSADRRRRNAVLAAGAMALLFFACYAYWDGGWCTGPRHLVPAVALLLYEGVGVLARHPRFLKPFWAASALGVGVNLLAVATNPCPTDQAKYPLEQIWIPRLRHDQTADAILVDLGMRRGAYMVWIWLALALVLGAGLALLARKMLAPQPEKDAKRGREPAGVPAVR